LGINNIHKRQFEEYFKTVKIKQENNHYTEDDIFTPLEIVNVCLGLKRKYTCLIWFLYLSGLRIHEAIQVKLSNCTVLEDCVLIKILHGKGNRKREIIIPKDLYYEIRSSHAGLMYLFESKPSVHYGKNSIQRYFRKISKKINKRFTPHLLRHSFITNHLNAKTDVKLLSKFVGTSPEVLLARYHHPKLNKAEFLNISSKGTKYANTI
jgi:integrase